MPFSNSPKTPSTPRLGSSDSVNSQTALLFDDSLAQLFSDKLDDAVRQLKKNRDNKELEREILEKVKRLEEQINGLKDKEPIKPPVYELESKIEPVMKNPLEDIPPPVIRKARYKLPMKNVTNPEGHQRKSIHDQTETSTNKRMVPMDTNQLIGH